MGTIEAAALEVLEASEGLMIPYWSLRFLRFVTLLGLHGLFVPVTTALFSPFNCRANEVWGMAGADAGLKCLQGEHLGYLVASIFLLPLWIGWSIVVAACMINRVPDLTGKRNILCASHGRVFAVLVALKALLSGVFVCGEMVQVWVYAVVMLVAGLVYCIAYWQYLPYYHQYLNQAQLAIGCVLTEAAASLILANAIGDGTNSAGPTAFLILLMPAIYVGYSLGNLRFKSFGRQTELSSPFAVELRMRYLLADLVAQIGHAPDAAAALTRTQHATSLYAADTRGAGGSSASATWVAHEDRVPVEQASLLRSTNADVLVASSLTAMEQLFKEASGVFASSAILHLF